MASVGPQVSSGHPLAIAPLASSAVYNPWPGEDSPSSVNPYLAIFVRSWVPIMRNYCIYMVARRNYWSYRK